MKLVIKNTKLSKDHFPHKDLQIVGNENDAVRIRELEDLIDAEILPYTDELIQTYSDMCSDHRWGYSVTWTIDAEYADELKSVIVKHMKAK